jgi:GTPase SAR1 family protein
MFIFLTLALVLQVPIVVVGNKVDMPKKKRVVSKEEGQALAEEFNASFIEVSVRTIQCLIYNLFYFSLLSAFFAIVLL